MRCKLACMSIFLRVDYMANAIQREEAQRIRTGISFDLYSANAEQ